MNLIASVDRNWGIGNQDELLVRIPEDMKRFRRMTLGNTVVVGRRTLATFPNGAPLTGRSTLVLSASPGFAVPGAQVCSSLAQALEVLEGVASESVFIIGGQQIYELFLPYCNTAYLTRLNSVFPADRFFPKLSELPGWTLEETSEVKSFEGLRFWYETYRRAA